MGRVKGMYLSRKHLILVSSILVAVAVLLGSYVGLAQTTTNRLPVSVYSFTKPYDALVYLTDNGEAVAINKQGQIIAGPSTNHTSVWIKVKSAIEKGIIRFAPGVYNINPLVIDKSYLTIIGSGMYSTLINGSVIAGTTAQRTAFIGISNLQIVGTLKFVRVNSGWTCNIRAQNLEILGAWGFVAYGVLLLQGGTGIILHVGTEPVSGEKTTDAHIESVIIEDNQNPTDIGIQVDAGSRLSIDSAHIESSIGLMKDIVNNGELYIKYAELRPFSTDDPNSVAFENNGLAVGTLRINRGNNQLAVNITSNKNRLTLIVGDEYASGSIQISGNDNIINLYTYNTISLTVSGTGNIIKGKFRSVYGTVSIAPGNNVEELAIDDKASGQIKYFSNSGKTVFSGDGVTTTFVIPHGLVGTPSVVIVTPGSPDATGQFYVTANATDIIVTYLTAPPAGTDNIVLYWKAKI